MGRTLKDILDSEDPEIVAKAREIAREIIEEMELAERKVKSQDRDVGSKSSDAE